ncbi:MAG TPA: DUF2334 domain-containing protein [Thermoleophilaceae bacterium]
MSRDDERNAKLLGAPAKTRPVPPAPVRLAQRAAMKAGLLRYEPRNPGPPRFLIRADEFPNVLAQDEPDRYGLEASRSFHAKLAERGVPYLMAVLPRVPTSHLDPSAEGDRPLSDAEREFLGEMAGQGVTFGLHGYNHRTRDANPRRHSELSGLSPSELNDLLDRALAELASANVAPRVFVPPFNRFDAAQYDVLAARFDVVCGGPESVPLMGFQRGPQWRGAAVYLPSYPPLYGTADETLPMVASLIERQAGGWVPIVLHPGWEIKAGLEALQAFADEVAPYAASWGEFLAAVSESS